MKTEEQIKAKLAECEEFIKRDLKKHSKDKNAFIYMDASRDVLRWILAEGLITPDKLAKKINREILILESTKI